MAVLRYIRPDITPLTSRTLHFSIFNSSLPVILFSAHIHRNFVMAKMSITPDSEPWTEEPASPLSPEETDQNLAPAPSPNTQSLESLPLELLLKIFTFTYSSPEDDFANLLSLWEQRRTSKRFLDSIERIFREDHLHHVEIETEVRLLEAR